MQRKPVVSHGLRVYSVTGLGSMRITWAVLTLAIHYGSAHAKTIEDYKAVSMNMIHSSMKITDEFYSNLYDGEIQNRIGSLGKEKQLNNNNQEAVNLFKEFLAWKQKPSR
jgi:hypothetical protein